MAHIREVKRAQGTAWEVRWREQGVFKQRSFPTEEEADDFRHEVRIEKRDGGTANHLAGRSPTFRAIAEASMQANATRLKAKTAGGYELGYRVHIYPTFGDRRINTITSMEIEKWIRGMETKLSDHTGRPLAPASVHACFIALSKVFAYAVKHKVIPANPCAVVDKPRLVHTEPVFLDPEQVEAVAAELDKNAPYGLIVRFAAYSGLRAGELAALRIRDLNFLRSHVEVRRTVQRTKGGWTFGTPKTARSTRDVPLRRDLLADLAAYLERHPNRHDPEAGLWPGRLPGNHRDDPNVLDYDRQFDPVTVYRYFFKPALVRLGLPAVRWHDLRHFYASACAAAGIDIRKVSRWMGHASVNTTDSIYTHLFNGDHSSDMDKLDELASRPAAVPLPRLGRADAYLTPQPTSDSSNVAPLRSAAEG